MSAAEGIFHCCRLAASAAGSLNNRERGESERERARERERERARESEREREREKKEGLAFLAGFKDGAEPRRHSFPRP